ncbi:hypothetical protein [Candidatus Venteria ishoeyi]|uniref:Uncharacterized protein n=1 Tax=Candidatus Venteria ishoeyi TaxID=1899563 RepID=A0A1H6F593_9GAMM|nr:hypothetical protein [Candidatus Venteria ishoeyi]SEH04246.1 Uncharacterised protein [Candidatus Venteria ishoeyi]
MRKLDVILKIHKFLKAEGLLQRQVSRIYTDTHPTLVETKALSPFQRFTLTLTDFSAHPVPCRAIQRW